MRALGYTLVLILSSGCAGAPWPRTPMASILRPAGTERAGTLIVFLPGLKDRARVFDREGFVGAIRRRELAIDLVAADAHAGYYMTGTLLRRLHHDIIEPARKRGYRRIVFVGVSMGGYGAIRYAMTYPREISAIVLLSPFLGAGPFLRELADAGDEDFAQTWDWLKSYPADEDRAKHPRLILAYGQMDAFLKTDNELRALLPPGDVVTTFGAHVWGTWRTLLGEILDKQLISDGR